MGVGTKFTIGSLFRTFTGMAISLFALSIVGPEEIGLWHAALILKPYLGFAQLGITEGIGRELPFFMGKKKSDKVKDFAANGQWVTILYTGISLLLTIVITLIAASGAKEILVFLTAGIFISTMFIDNYLSSTYRSSRSFLDLVKVYIISSVFGLLLTPLIYFHNFHGYMALLLMQSLLYSLLLIKYRPIRIFSRFDPKIYKETVKIGFPILSFNFIRSIPDTYPKILIVFFISTTALGLTAPANATLTAFAVLPAALAKYFYPTITYRFGKEGDPFFLWKKAKEIAFYLLIIGLVGSLSLLIIPHAIETYFPKYETAVKITMIAVGIGLVRMFSILYNIFNTLKSYKAQSIVSVSRNVLYLVIPSLFYHFGSGNNHLEMIFLGVLCAETISAVIMGIFLYKVTHGKNL